MEQRKAQRFGLNLPLTLVVSDDVSDKRNSIQGTTQNISSCGALIQTDEALPIQTPVDVHLVLPLDELKEVQGQKVNVILEGWVVRAQENHLGISFDEQYRMEMIQSNNPVPLS